MQRRDIVDGARHGFERWWLDRRSVHLEGHYIAGLEHGVFREWNAKGKLRGGFPTKVSGGLRSGSQSWPLAFLSATDALAGGGRVRGGSEAQASRPLPQGAQMPAALLPSWASLWVASCVTLVASQVGKFGLFSMNASLVDSSAGNEMCASVGLFWM